MNSLSQSHSSLARKSRFENFLNDDVFDNFNKKRETETLELRRKLIDNESFRDLERQSHLFNNKNSQLFV